MKVILGLAFVTTLVVSASAQSPSGPSVRVYTGNEPFSNSPQLSYGAVRNALVKVKSGDAFTYQLYIGDKDQWTYYFIENNTPGSEIKTLEDTYVKFIPIEIQSTSDGTMAEPSAAHDGDAAKYTLTYAGVAKTVTQKSFVFDTFKPTNEQMPEELLRDPINANDIVKVFFEISPQ